MGQTKNARAETQGALDRDEWRADGHDIKMLQHGRQYRVKREFRDYDGDVHSEGEAWTFRGYSFLPYDDGLSLFVSMQSDDEWKIRLQLRTDQQAHITDDMCDYLEQLE